MQSIWQQNAIIDIPTYAKYIIPSTLNEIISSLPFSTFLILNLTMALLSIGRSKSKVDRRPNDRE